MSPKSVKKTNCLISLDEVSLHRASSIVKFKKEKEKCQNVFSRGSFSFKICFCFWQNLFSNRNRKENLSALSLEFPFVFDVKNEIFSYCKVEFEFDLFSV